MRGSRGARAGDPWAIVSWADFGQRAVRSMQTKRANERAGKAVKWKGSVRTRCTWRITAHLRRMSERDCYVICQPLGTLGLCGAQG